MKVTQILCLLSIITVSCRKFEEFKTDENTNFNTEEKMTAAITGAYDRFKYIFINYYTNGTSTGYDWYQIPNSKGDDFCHSTLNLGYYELVDSQFVYHCTNESSNNPLYPYNEVTDPWYDCYKTIISLNNIIIHAEQQKDLSAGVKKILGEAYLLRGYVYFRLVRIYGEVPLIKDTQISYKVPKSSFKEIYDFIVQDLEKAENLLPANNAEARIPFSTPHVGTAKAILAEVYLTMAGYPLKQTQYYAKAAEISGNLIDSADYYGYKILPDFADLWKHQVQWNAESVLAINYYKSGVSLGWGGFIGGPFGDNTVGILAPTHGVTYGAGIKFYNNYPKSYRKSITYYSLLIKPRSLNTLKDFNYYIVREPDSMDLCTPIYYNKFDLTWDFDSVDVWNPTDISQVGLVQKKSRNFNLYIFRYAQTLLTFAEAKARSGQLDDRAYLAVNIIRRRAHKVDLYSPSPYDLTPGLSPEQFADSVVWERAWELCAEPEGRWFDLVRLEMVEDLPSLRDKNDMQGYPDVINKDFYFTPIPQTEIDFDPNLQ